MTQQQHFLQQHLKQRHSLSSLQIIIFFSEDSTHKRFSSSTASKNAHRLRTSHPRSTVSRSILAHHTFRSEVSLYQPLSNTSQTTSINYICDPRLTNLLQKNALITQKNNTTRTKTLFKDSLTLVPLYFCLFYSYRYTIIQHCSLAKTPRCISAITNKNSTYLYKTTIKQNKRKGYQKCDSTRQTFYKPARFSSYRLSFHTSPPSFRPSIVSSTPLKPLNELSRSSKSHNSPFAFFHTLSPPFHHQLKQHCIHYPETFS